MLGNATPFTNVRTDAEVGMDVIEVVVKMLRVVSTCSLEVGLTMRVVEVVVT